MCLIVYVKYLLRAFPICFAAFVLNVIVLLFVIVLFVAETMYWIPYTKLLYYIIFFD